MTPEDNSPTVSHPVSGNDVTFAKLSLDDVYVQILGEKKKERKRLLIENLKLMEIPKEQWLEELQVFDEEPVTMDQFIRFSNDGPGRIALAKYTWHKAHPEATDVMPVMTEDEMYGLVRKVCAGLPIVFGGSPEPEDKPTVAYGQEGITPANPPTAAYGQ